MDYLGVNIEGPSSEGFCFYPVYRVHGDVEGALPPRSGGAPHIYPDRKVHQWSLKYDPAGAGGRGRITVSLDAQTCTLDLEPGAKEAGATFDRFGICTPWIDGNAVTVFFDDLVYTCRGNRSQGGAEGDKSMFRPTSSQKKDTNRPKNGPLRGPPGERLPTKSFGDTRLRSTTDVRQLCIE
jgi:hypothetical protein